MINRWEEVVIRFQICIFDILNTAFRKKEWIKTAL